MTNSVPRSSQEQWRVRANASLAGGVSSNTRLLNPPLIVEKGRGCRIWDVDGKEYVDHLLGQGPNFLGYAHPRVLPKVLEAQAGGVIFAATHPREIEAAERLLNVLSWADLIRFGSSSSEMVQAALRMARVSTGRTRFVRFHGHYHGWFDNIHIRSRGASYEPFGGGQSAAALADATVLQWNDLSAFEEAVTSDPDGLAAVIMEPMMFNAGAILPLPGYLEAIREICTRYGIVLIFDETISGFRVALGGAAERLGVTPDLAIYGKAMAAGYPCAAVAGKRELFAGVSTGRSIRRWRPSALS
jgi:glutamate-1-semialdehyde 2,1-aminomutase